jgi:hypothetical protein
MAMKFKKGDIVRPNGILSIYTNSLLIKAVDPSKEMYWILEINGEYDNTTGFQLVHENFELSDESIIDRVLLKYNA